MQESGAFPETAEIIDTLKDDPAVDTERVERSTVVDRTEERVDLVSEVTLEVTEQIDRKTFPQSGYEYLCRQRVPYSECYDYAPEDFSEQTIEFVETGCQPQRCGDCDGDGQTVCLDCGGKGTEQCPECHGTGTQECSDCFGTGMGGGWDDDLEEGPCMTCGGSGEVVCDFGCDGGQLECESCHGRGIQECSLCSGEGTIVTAAYGAIKFTKTRTVQTAATAFDTDLFELEESDGTLVDRSREEPDDRVAEGDGGTQVWRRIVEQRSIPCVSVTYECNGETYTAGWVDGEVRLGEYPPSEAAIREQIERAVDENQFTYDSSPEDGIKSLIVADVVKTIKTLLWLFGGILAVSVGINVVIWLLGSVLPVSSVLSVSSVGTTGIGVLGLIVAVVTSLYLAARLHERTRGSSPGRSLAAIAGPAMVSVVAVVLIAAGEVSLLVGASLFGFAATLWGVTVARHLRSIAEEAAFVSDRRQTFLTETLDYPPRVVNRHELGDLLPAPQPKTERRANRMAAVVGIGCVGVVGVYTLGVLMLSLLQFAESASMSIESTAAVGVLALPAALTLVSVGALIGVRR